MPWLGPPIGEVLEELAAAGRRRALAVPIGFVSDHVEVLYDLDFEARGQAARLGLVFERTESLNTSPRFVDALADLVRRGPPASLDRRRPRIPCRLGPPCRTSWSSGAESPASPPPGDSPGTVRADLERTAQPPRPECARRTVSVTVVEASPRFGGKIVTERVGGFLVDGGADSFASRKPRGVGLVRELGLGDRLIPTGSGEPPGAPAPVHVLRGGRLVPLPAGLSLVVPTRLGPLVRSPLLSLRGKLRVGLDLVLPGPSPIADGIGRGGEPRGDESVADLVRRRFGAEYLERLAGPLLAGIHSTDPEELSVAAAFPHLAAMERRHRSLLLAVRGNGGRRPARGAGPSGEAGRAPTPDTAAARVSLRGGMGELVDALVEALRGLSGLAPEGVSLRSGRGVLALEPRPGGGWTLRLDGGEALGADAVVLAAPPAVVASLVRDLDPGVAASLLAIPHVSSATVSLGYPRAAVTRPLRGMGFLVPRGEACRISACTFSSEKFPGRAPADHVLVRAFVGGAFATDGADSAERRGAEPTGLTDAELTALVHGELARLLGLTAGPVMARVHRFRAANPQYRIGHLERVAELDRRTPPGLVLAGCAYHGLGVPDCVASGERAARRALEAAVG